MVRLLSFLFSAMLVFSSCQKEINIDLGTGNGGSGGGGTGGTSSNFLRCKVDGVDKSFNFMCGAFKLDTLGQFILGLHGSTNSTATEGITITISGTSAVTVGSYSEVNPALNYGLGAVYVVGATNVWGAGLNPVPAHPFTVVFTSVTATRVQGTFTGGVYNDNGFGTIEKMLTNGEFSLPIQ